MRLALLSVVLLSTSAFAGNVPRITSIRIIRTVVTTPRDWDLLVQDPSPSTTTATFVRVVEPGTDGGEPTVGPRIPVVTEGADHHAEVVLEAFPAAGAVVGLTVTDAKGGSLGSLKGTVGKDGRIGAIGGSFTSCVDAGTMSLDSEGDVVIGLSTGICDLGKATVSVSVAGKTTDYAATLSSTTRRVAALDGPLPSDAVVRLVEVDKETKEREVLRVAPWTQTSRSSIPLDWQAEGYAGGSLWLGYDGTFVGGEVSTVVTRVLGKAAVPTGARVTTLHADATAGEVLEADLSSVQKFADVPVSYKSDRGVPKVMILLTDGTASRPSNRVATSGGGVCGTLPTKAPAGACFYLFGDDETGWTLEATSYAVSEADLPASLTVALQDEKGNPLTGDKTYTLTFGADRLATYSVGYTPDGDPTGSTMVAAVRLLGGADEKGRPIVIAKDRVRGVFTTSTGATAWQMTGLDADDALAPRGDILIGGEPIGIERPVEGGGTILVVPDVLMEKGGTGTGDRPIGGGGQTQQSELL